VGLGSIALRCRDVAANEAFWTEAVGLVVSDWAGDAVFLALDDAHHRIALYPSASDGLLKIDFEVETVNNVMQNFYRFQRLQLPIVHGPGRAPTSDRVFVVTRGPGEVLVSYSTEHIGGEPRHVLGPRQFPDRDASHCSWGSDALVPEFKGAEH
jgi:2,3-dihydroxy-p-cumate/2,3-dihydroxybenzoate 3,4-dioxygenase